MRLVSPTFWSRKCAFSTPFSRLARCFIRISKWSNSTRKPHKTPFLSALSIFRLLQLFFIGIPSGKLCGVERHKTQSHGHILIKGNCAVFIKYALIIPRACLGRTAARSPAKSSYMCCLRLALKGVASEGKDVIYTGFSRSLSDEYAMLMSPSKGETAVHGCYCPRDLAVRTREVMARPWGGVCVLLAEIYL